MMKLHCIFGAILLIGILTGHAAAQTPSGAYSSPAAGSGGGITSISSLPALPCTEGSTVYLNTASGALGKGNYTCISGVWTISSPDNVISPLAFGAKADTQFCFGTNVSWPNSSSTITVDGTNCRFKASDTGKTAFGTDGCCIQLASQGGLVRVPTGTLTFVNSTTATISTTSTAACGPAATQCIFVWGTDDTAALAAAWAAVVALPNCGTLQLPMGYMLTKTAQFQTSNATTCTAAAIPLGATFGASYSVRGYGVASSLIVPTPDFNFGTCINSGCFGGVRFMDYADWGIYGAGNGGTAAGSALSIVKFGVESAALNFEIASWGGADANLTCMTIDGRYYNVHCMGAGSKELIVGGLAFMVNGQFNYSKSAGVIVQAEFHSINSFYGFLNDSNAIVVDVLTANLFDSKGDGFTCTQTNNYCVRLSNAGAILQMVNGSLSANAASTNSALWLNAAGSKANITNSSLLGGSAGGSAIRNDGGTYFDGGSNTYTGAAFFSGTVGVTPTCVFTSGGGTTPSCSVQAGSTNEKGTIIATTGTGAPGSKGTITMTFAGTFAGATGTTPLCVPNPDNTATVWGDGATAFVNTQSSTVPVFAWSNYQNATNVATLTALTVSSAYRIGYTCIAR